MPTVGIIRSIVWYVWPTLGFGWGGGAPQWGVGAYFTIQVMWLNRGIAFDWQLGNAGCSTK